MTDKNLRMINDPIYFSPPSKVSSFKKFLVEYCLDPSSLFTLICIFINLLVTVFLFVYIPFAVCVFDEELNNRSFLRIIKINCIIILLLDVVRKLNTAFYKKGLLVRRKSAIIRKYAKKYLIYDLVSIFPLIFVEFVVMTKVSQIFLIFFYLKLKHFNESIIKFEEVILMHFKFNNVLSLIKLVARMIMLSHIFACLWIYIGNLNYYETSWIKQKNLENESIVNIFLYSYYFVCVTINTVGYGDISPTNPIETWFIIIFIYVACVVFAYTINSIGLILDNINKNQKDYLKEVNLVNNFMREKNINFDLRIRVRKYFEYIWTEEKVFKTKEQTAVLKKLSESLKEEVLIEAYGHIVRNIKFLSFNFSEESLRKIVPMLKERRFTPGDIIFMDDDQKDCDLYIVTKGSVELFLRGVGKNQQYTTVKKVVGGDVFGEFAFMTGQPRKTGAKSLDFTTIYCIRQEDFVHIVKENQIDYEIYCRIRDSILLYGDFNLMYSKCPCCKLSGHLVGNCSLLHYIAPVDIILRKHNYSEHQMRMYNFDRKDVKRAFRTKTDSLLIKLAAQYHQRKSEEKFADSLNRTHTDESIKHFKQSFPQYSSNKYLTRPVTLDENNCSINEANEEESECNTEGAIESSRALISSNTKTRSKKYSHEESMHKSKNFDESLYTEEYHPSQNTIASHLTRRSVHNILDIMKKIVQNSEIKIGIGSEFFIELDKMRSYDEYFPANNVENVIKSNPLQQINITERRKTVYQQVVKVQNWSIEKKKKTVKGSNFFRSNFFRDEKYLEKLMKEEDFDPIHLKNHFKKLYHKRTLLGKLLELIKKLKCLVLLCKKRKRIQSLTLKSSKSERSMNQKSLRKKK